MVDIQVHTRHSSIASSIALVSFSLAILIACARILADLRSLRDTYFQPSVPAASTRRDCASTNAGVSSSASFSVKKSFFRVLRTFLVKRNIIASSFCGDSLHFPAMRARLSLFVARSSSLWFQGVTILSSGHCGPREAKEQLWLVTPA